MRKCTKISKISIHVPREGHDTQAVDQYIVNKPISIHVPREGHDSPWATSFESAEDFNPRAPRGARLGQLKMRLYLKVFQSTCPARGTTGAVS